MSKQTTQKETIDFIREEDFMNTGVSKKERRYIRKLHKECKQFLKDVDRVKKAVEGFEIILDECSSGTDDYYRDVVEFLKDDEMEEKGYNMIDGYRKWVMNSGSLLQFMEKIWEVKEGIVNY